MNKGWSIQQLFLCLKGLLMVTSISYHIWMGSPQFKGLYQKCKSSNGQFMEFKTVNHDHLKWYMVNFNPMDKGYNCQVTV